MKKEDIRKKYKLIRKLVKDKNEKSDQIMYKLMNSLEYGNSKVIALYKSFSSEVNTNDLIKKIISDGKIVVLPKVHKNELKFYRINSLNDSFVKNKFGIDEPNVNDENFVSKEEINLIVVPRCLF